MKTYGGMEIVARVLNIGARWSEQLHAPAVLPSWERASCTPWIGGWVGSRAGQNVVTKRKKSLPRPFQESNPGRRVRSSDTELPQLLFNSVESEIINAEMIIRKKAGRKTWREETTGRMEA
jgi:hypothetical protein